MDTLLILLGGTDGRYAVLAAISAAVLTWGAWSPRRVPSWGFVLLVGACLLACRWPIAVHNVELGVDESQALAAAMRLSAFPVPWKYVDINTAGPLNALPFVVLSWLGFSIDFVMSHLVGLIMVWLALGGAYLFLRETSDERVARCGILPAVAFFSLGTFFDFVHTTSEHVPMALIGIGSAALWQGAWRGSWPRVCLGMLALGATPWAKLQSVPLALWFCLAGGLVIVGRWRANRTRLVRLMAAWLGGGLAVSVLFGLMLVIWGLVPQWRVAYMQQALNYVDMGGLSFGQFWIEAWGFCRQALETTTLALPLMVAVIVLAGAAVVWRPRRPAELVAVAVHLGAVAVAAYIIAAPGRLFYHYLLFGVIPLCLLAASLLDVAWRGWDARSGQRRWIAHGILAVFLVATLLPQIHARTLRDHPSIPYQRGNVALRQSEPAKTLAAAARPGDTMTVWGWEARLYVESGLVQATRDGQTERQISENPLREFYRGRYLFDLRRHRPAFFVEAVGPEFFVYQDRATEGFETWPELKAYIEAHYDLLAEVASCRIYRARPDPAARDDRRP